MANPLNKFVKSAATRFPREDVDFVACVKEVEKMQLKDKIVKFSPSSISLLNEWLNSHSYISYSEKRFFVSLQEWKVVVRIDTKLRKYSGTGVQKKCRLALQEASQEILNAMAEEEIGILDNIKHVTQMDNDEKSMLDGTKNFAAGIQVNDLNNNDDHMSFNNVLQNPVLIIDRKPIAPNTAFARTHFIPVMPPQIAMVGGDGYFADTIIQSGTCVLTSMYKMCRGDSRYKLIFTPNSNSPQNWDQFPIYVSYIPNTGVILHGNIDMAVSGSFNFTNTNFMSTSLRKIVCIPKVLPTVDMEVPFSNPFEFQRLHMPQSLPNNTQGWRDWSTYCAGHVIIQTLVDCDVTVFWSASPGYILRGFSFEQAWYNYGRSGRFLNDANLTVTAVKELTHKHQTGEDTPAVFAGRKPRIASKSSVTAITKVVASPFSNFGTGGAEVDIQRLASRHKSSTTMLKEHTQKIDPQSFFELSRMWGFKESFIWNTSQAAGQLVYTLQLDLGKTDNSSGSFCPLEVVAKMFNMWHGTLEFRFDFCSNAFHTGALTFAIEFGDVDPVKLDLCSESSAYSKTFQVGDQTQCLFTAPFIYDQIWRRLPNMAFYCRANWSEAVPLPQTETLIISDTPAYLTVRVANPLTPIASVSQDIDILVYMRGGEDIAFNHPVASNIVSERRDPFSGVGGIGRFPLDMSFLKHVTQMEALATTALELCEGWGDIAWDNSDVMGNIGHWSDVASGTGPASDPSTGTEASQSVVSEKESIAGDATQLSSKQSNVVLTFDSTVQITNTKVVPSLTLMKACSTEPFLNFPTNMTRWVKQYSGVVTAGANYYNVENYPFAVVADVPCAINNNMFENMLYGRIIPQVNIMVTGNKFMSGKLYAAWVPLGDNLISSTLDRASLLANPHVVLDVSCRNNGQLQMEHVWMRPLQQVKATSPNGSRILVHSQLVIFTIVPVRVGPGSVQTVPFTVWTRYIRADFAGMSRKVPISTTVDMFNNARCMHVQQAPPDEETDIIGDPEDFHDIVNNDDNVVIDQESLLDKTKRVVNDTLDNITSTPLAMAAVSVVPFAGPAALAYKASNTMNKVDALAGETSATLKKSQVVMDAAKSTLSSFQNFASNLDTASTDLLKQLTEMVTSIINPIKNTCSTLFDFKTISDVLLEFVYVLINPTWSTAAVVIAKILYKLNIINFESLGTMYDAITPFFKRMFNTQEIHSPQEPSSGEAKWITDREISSIGGLIITCLCGFLSVTCTDFSIFQSKLATGLFKFATGAGAWSILTNSTRFLEYILTFVRRCFYWLLRKKDPELEAVENIIAVKEEVKEFIVRSSNYLHVANSDYNSYDPEQKCRNYILYCDALRLREKFVSNDTRELSAIISRMLVICNQVIKKMEGEFENFKNSPVKFEPFVVMLHGDAGIGKSFLVPELAKELLKAISFHVDSINFIFTRIPANAYWDGYVNQPVVVYDDFLNINTPEQANVQLGEFYSLKSSACYNPPFASIEEKKQQCAPVIVFLCANEPFPALPTVSCPKAVFRRRDFMVKVQRSTGVDGFRDDFSHLNFKIAADPKSAVNTDAGYSTDGVSYPEFKEKLITSFKSYVAIEKRNVAKRMAALKAVVSTEATIISDPFVRLENLTTVANGVVGEFSPSEVLKRKAELIVRAIQDRNDGLENVNQMFPLPSMMLQYGATSLIKTGIKFSVYLSKLFHSCMVKFNRSLDYENVCHVDSSFDMVRKCMVCWKETKCVFRCEKQEESEESDHFQCLSCYETMDREGSWWLAERRARACCICRDNILVPIFKRSVMESYFIHIITIASLPIEKIAYYHRLFMTKVFEEYGSFGFGFFLNYQMFYVTNILFPSSETLLYSIPVFIAETVSDMHSAITPPISIGVLDINETSHVQQMPSSVNLDLEGPHITNYALNNNSPFKISIVTSMCKYKPRHKDWSGVVCEGVDCNTIFENLEYLDEADILSIDNELTRSETFRLASRNQKLFLLDCLQILQRYAVTSGLHILVSNFVDSLIAKPLKLLDRDALEYFEIGDSKCRDTKEEIDVLLESFIKKNSLGQERYDCPHWSLVEEFSMSAQWNLEKKCFNGVGQFVGMHIPMYPCGNKTECILNHVPYFPSSMRSRHFIINLLSNVYCCSPYYIGYKKRDVSIAARKELGGFPLYYETASIDVLEAMGMVRQTSTFIDDLKSKKKSIMQRVLSGLDSFVSSIPKIIKYLLLGVGALYGLYRTYSFFSSVTGVGSTVSQVYDGVSQPRHFLHKTAFVRTGLTTHVKQGYQVERDALHHRIDKNNFMYILQWLDDKGKIVENMMRCVGIAGKIAILPKHYRESIFKKYATFRCRSFLRLYGAAPLIEYRFHKLDFIDSENSDLTVFKLPANVPMFTDIRDKFAPRAWFDNNQISSNVEIVGVRMSIDNKNRKSDMPSVIDRTLNVHTCKFKRIAASRAVSDGEGGSVEWSSTIEYEFSQSGACGSLVLMVGHNTPIIGMHIYGTESGYIVNGGAVHLCSDDFVNVDFGVAERRKPKQMEATLEKTKIGFDSDIVVRYHGVVEPNLEPYYPEKSKIIPSLIHKSQFLPPPSGEPAILSARDPRYPKVYSQSPLEAGVAKHGVMTRSFQSHVIDRASELLFKNVITTMTPIPGRSKPDILDIQLAVCGVAGDVDIPFFDPIKLTTSAGWPWNTTPRKQKKDWICAIRDEQEVMIKAVLDKELLDTIESNLLLRNQSISPGPVFEDQLKDERKEYSKLYSLGKTRVFCMSPQELTIEMRMFTQDFCASMMHNRILNSCAIGISVDGPEWTRMVNYLGEVGSKILTIDYSNFGPGFNAVVAERAFSIIIQWYLTYNPSLNYSSKRSVSPNLVDVPFNFVNVMQTFNLDLHNSLHIVRNLIYSQLAGSPSGASITTVLNCLVNLLYLYSFLVSVYGVDLELDFIIKHFRIVVYGDDVIMCVSDSQIDKVNMLTMKAWFGEHLINITPTSKDGDIDKPYISLLEAEFLKRSFALHPHSQNNMVNYLAPIRDNVITDCAQWCWKSSNHTAATVENADQALRLAYGKGPDYFNTLKIKLNSALIDIGVTPMTLTWQELDRNFFPIYN